MDILKNSEKYTVFKIRKKKIISILKVSNRTTDKILREIYHIKKLKRSSTFLNKKIPSIIAYGKINKGINKNKGYYKMPFINGPTLSEIFQKKTFNGINKIKLFDNLSNYLIKEVRKAKFKKKKNSFILFKKLLDKEYKKILEKELFKNLLNRKNILINNKSYSNISYCLNKILTSKKVKYLNKKYKFISTINHWNFHGGNIIFPKKDTKDFKIIDPDSSWEYNDPFFSLARLIYTFPHDTMEYDKYCLISNDFEKKIKKKSISFKIEYLWNKKVKKNYEEVFLNFFNNFKKKNIFNKKLTKIEFLRFNLTLILCFLRGINANHQPKINFLMAKSKNFQNKGLYIYLFFLIYLNNFTKKILND